MEANIVQELALEHVDVVVVGGGPAGLAAAVELHKKGITHVVVLEREKQLGGILRQCIHDGFGLTRFQTTLSERAGVRPALHPGGGGAGGPVHHQRLGGGDHPGQGGHRRHPDGTAPVEGQGGGVVHGLPGAHPGGPGHPRRAAGGGVLYNRMPAKEVVILGSGDIGMIMARRLTLEGAHVHGVFEVQPYPSGLPRNIQQCLEDYGIPLYLSHTVTDIHGGSRLTGVTVSRVDEKGTPIPGTEREYPCDTLILSVGLLPENELSQEAGVALDSRTRGAVVDEHCQTSVEGIFAAGNVLHVHDLVDFVSLEAERMADWAARYVREGALPSCPLAVQAGEGVGHTIPQAVSGTEDVRLSLRVRAPFRDGSIVVRQNGREVVRKPMKRALPAEMIWLEVPADRLDRQGDLEVCAEW